MPTAAGIPRAPGSEQATSSCRPCYVFGDLQECARVNVTLRRGLRTFFTIAGVMVGGAIVAAPASAQCGERTTGYPAHWTGGGPPPLVIGDSVLYEVVPLLTRLGFEADAMVCRQVSQGLALLAQRGSSLPHLVIFELGTNGLLTEADIDAALRLLGPHRLLGLITPHNG